MNKGTKAFLILWLILFLLPVINSFLEAYNEDPIPNPFDYARITDVDYRAELVDEPGSNGKVIVTEKLTFDIHAASKSNPFWELWRDLPESYIDGVKVDYKVNSVKQINSNGTETIYEESPKLYWYDSDYTSSQYGPEKWYHSEGPYNEDLDRYECVFFYVDGLYREKVVFEIEYEMYNAALRYKDCSELYLNMYSEETVKYLESFKGEILIPNKDMPSVGNYEAHTYGTNSFSFPFTESSTKNPGYHTFSFDLTESDLKFKPYNQYIEFSLVSFGEDRRIFTENARANRYTNTNVLEEIRDEHIQYTTVPSLFQKAKIFILIGALIGAFFILHYSFNIMKKMKKKHIFYEPTMKMDYFRDIPSNLDPHFASALVFCKEKPKKPIETGYAALLLSLVRKGYVELAKLSNTSDWSFSNCKIVVKYHPKPAMSAYEPLGGFGTYTGEQEEPKVLEHLTQAEEYYFNLIVRHSKGTEISMHSFQGQVSYDYINTDTFVRNIERSVVNIGVSQKYFQKSNYQEPMHNMRNNAFLFKVIGVVLMTIVNIICYHTYIDLAFGSFFILGLAFLIGAHYIKKESKKGILLTQFGEDEYVKWRGLYNFLNSDTLLNERTLIELPIWEQYLIYATAFGISDKVIKALSVRCDNIDQSAILSNPYCRSRNFYTSSRHFRTATHHASSTARSGGYYSGSGGHGGYGGGGRGGGGGRRRSLKI